MGHRVFVVDAEDGSRLALANLLRNRGYEVGVTGRWDRLFPAFEEEPWDLLMADPAPAVDFTAILLRLHSVRPMLPIFLVTSFRSHEEDLDRIRPVCRRIFEKPVDLESVDDALKEIFRVR